MLEINLIKDTFHAIFQILKVVLFFLVLDNDHGILFAFFFRLLHVVFTLFDPDSQVIFATLDLFTDFFILNPFSNTFFILREVVGLVH